MLEQYELLAMQTLNPVSLHTSHALEQATELP